MGSGTADRAHRPRLAANHVVRADLHRCWSARLVASLSVVLAVAVGVAALLGTAALGGIAILRFRATHEALHAERPVGDGRAPLLIATLTVLTGIGALLYVVST